MDEGPFGRVVIKVGTAGLVDESKAFAPDMVDNLVGQVADVWDTGRDCVLVSSGAIASGLAPLGLRRRPTKLPALQAAAAVGQGRLMAEYARRFGARGLVIAQILLTQEDFVRRRQFVNAQRTFQHLLTARVVPVVNENDTVATEEITFGDNDRLAALVAIMVGADLLVLLSDVDGIFTRQPGEPGARFVREVPEGLRIEASGPRSSLGLGGMASKLEAAGLATRAGIPTVVANVSERAVLERILSGDRLGTWLPARGERKQARKAWMAFATTPRGRVLVDGRAEQAVREAGKSVLVPGVTGVEGSFSAGDAVEVAGPEGVVFARGITRYSERELSGFVGLRIAPAGAPDGGRRNGEVIHRDQLVLISSELWTR
jgi:glutamate 5-kinase